jgi:hypothetical protein
MKRDMDLVRKILLAMDAYEHGFAPHDLTIPGYDQEVIGHHVWLMAEGQLLTASTMTVSNSESPIALPHTITWKGHDFLDAVRNDSIWSKVKIQLKDHAITVPFALLQDLALKILAAHVGLLPPHQ